MFQGSAHVGKAEHIALVQAAGGTMNGTTWLDRTNYFETMPLHQLELALWLEADRMAHPARRPQPGEPRQPARGGQEREALVVRQPAVRQLVAEAPGPPLPAGPPVPPPDDRLDGGPRRGLARGRVGLLPDLLRPEQRGPGGRRRRRPGPGPRPGWSATSGGSRPTRRSRRLGDMSACRRRSAASAARRSYDRVPLPRDLLRLPGAGVRRPAPRRARGGRADPGRRQGQPALPPPRPRRAHRPGRGRSSRSGFVGGASIAAGWATVRPGVDLDGSRRPSRRSSSGWAASRSPTTSWPGPRP